MSYFIHNLYKKLVINELIDDNSQNVAGAIFCVPVLID